MSTLAKGCFDVYYLYLMQSLRLTAVIDTKLDAIRLAVLDCNATRVTDGRHAKPVHLIDR